MDPRTSLLLQEISLVIKYCRPQTTTIYWIVSGGGNTLNHMHSYLQLHLKKWRTEIKKHLS